MDKKRLKQIIKEEVWMEYGKTLTEAQKDKIRLEMDELIEKGKIISARIKQSMIDAGYKV